jgi:hypothetical protein
MKTSNKILLGLFMVIVVSMIIGTVVLKNKVKKNTRFENQIESTTQTDSVSTDSTSIHLKVSN